MPERSLSPPQTESQAPGDSDRELLRRHLRCSGTNDLQTTTTTPSTTSDDNERDVARPVHILDDTQDAACSSGWRSRLPILCPRMFGASSQRLLDTSESSSSLRHTCGIDDDDDNSTKHEQCLQEISQHRLQTSSTCLETKTGIITIADSNPRHCLCPSSCCRVVALAKRQQFLLRRLHWFQKQHRY